MVTDVNVGLLVFLAMSSLGVYAIVLAGWSSNNKYSLLGGLRSSAQMISYELAMGLVHRRRAPAGRVALAGRHRPGAAGLVHLGPVPFPRWYVFTQPVAFAIFVICAFAETNRAPFDLPEAESELVGGLPHRVLAA